MDRPTTAKRNIDVDVVVEQMIQIYAKKHLNMKSSMKQGSVKKNLKGRKGDPGSAIGDPGGQSTSVQEKRKT